MPDEAVSIRVDSDALVQLGRLMRSQEDGKQLRKDLIGDLRTAVAPGVSAVQGKLRSIPSSTAGSPPMGSYLASRVRTQVRLAGKSAGVRVRIAQTPALRGFRYAARRLNRDGWRHPVFAGEDHKATAGRSSTWVEQTSPIPGYFDDTLQAGKAQYRAAVLAAMEKMARTLTRR